MFVSMFKFYKLCLFSPSNLALLFRLLLLLGVFLIFMTTSLDMVDRFAGLTLTLEGGPTTNRSEEPVWRSGRTGPERIDVSEILPNCGIQYQCGEDEFPVHIYTGQDKDDEPKLCVGGKYVHGVGRGLNVAVVGSPRSTLKSLRNFDLYGQNGTGLEAWLQQQLDYNDIIIAFTFDEASKELSNNAKAILYLLGSGKIQDLQFRCQWYMISQKGIGGFTPLEEITYGKNFRWGKAIDKRLCVPKRIEATTVSPDPYPRRNPLRERLCRLSAELAEDQFCDSLARHEPYLPSQLTNRSLLGNVVFSTPVLVVAGPSLSTLALTLETLMYQPGIQPSQVIVIHTLKQIYVPVLVQIFNFKTLAINSSHPLTSNDKIEYGLNYVAVYLPHKSFAIVIEEGLILSWDFLFYMAQLVPNLYVDETILGVSSWNPYGFVGVSRDPYTSYRVEDFPGLGFLIRMSTYRQHMQGRMHFCCSKKSFQGWRPLPRSLNGTFNILIPDVSRVLRRPKDYFLRKRIDEEFKIFTVPRVTNTQLNTWIENPQELILENYVDKLHGLINGSITVRLNSEDLNACYSTGTSTVTRLIKELRHKTLSVFYNETEPTRTPVLKAHLRCFDIHVSPKHKVNNRFQKLLRFTLNTNTLLLIDSTSPFARTVLW